MSLHELNTRHLLFDPKTAIKDEADTAFHYDLSSSTTTNDLSWLAIQTMLSDASSNNMGTCDPSPFESPLCVSSMGSPNSSRDFDEPLITGSEGDATFERHPLFDGYTRPSYAEPTQDDAAWSLTGQGSFSYADFFPVSSTPAATTTGTKAATSASLTGSQYFATLPPKMDTFDAVAAFAAMQDIAPTSVVDNQQPYLGMSAQLNTHARRLSLSDSVSGYSSSQESAPPKDINSFVASSQASNDGASNIDQGEELRHLAEVLVQQYHAHGRGESDTSELVHALKVAGIKVEPNLLQAAEPLTPSDSAFSPASSSISSGGDGDWTEGSSPQSTHDDSRHATRKARSSSHTMSKYNALGESASASSFEEFDTVMKDGKRHYRCDVCHKLFDRAFNMKTHRVIHESYREQPFACPFDECGKRFSRKADCNRHTKSVHLRKGQSLNGRPLAVVVDVG